MTRLISEWISYFDRFYSNILQMARFSEKSTWKKIVTWFSPQICLGIQREFVKLYTGIHCKYQLFLSDFN
jgi:hypothetical protein